MKRIFTLLVVLFSIACAVPAQAQDCTGPNGDEGELIYNTGENILQFCNGSDWIAGGTTSDVPPAPGGCESGGISYAGYCWYVGAAGTSCTAACSTHGGYNDATRTVAGSSGSDLACQTIAAYFIGGTMTWDGNNCGGVAAGCTLTSSGQIYRCNPPATTAGSSFGGVARICACNE